MTPTAQTSEGAACASPRIASGDMYSGVAIVAPGSAGCADAPSERERADRQS